MAQHNSPKDNWIIIDTLIYNVSSFADLHPGGATVLHDIAGKEVTETFYGLHRHEVLSKFGPRLLIGKVGGETPKMLKSVQPGYISKVPYGEPIAWREAFRSPYYNASHIAFKKAVREFVQKYVEAEANEREQDGKNISNELWKLLGNEKINIWALRLGPGKHLNGRILMNGAVKPEEVDYFHELILNQEFARIICFGFNDGLGGGNAVSII